MDKRKVIFGWFVIIFILTLFLELTSYTIYRFVILSRSASFLSYNPPKSISRSEFEYYSDIHDPELGWPSTEALNSNKYDNSGSRPIPAFPTPGDECVSLYGDSFIYAEEVSDTLAWGNLLAKQLKCRVSNFGVGGYGTDQAYLRFNNNSSDHAPITILGIYPHNVLRNINQYRFLLTGAGSPFSFKPRFVIEEGDLRLIPKPDISYDELYTFFQNPSVFLKHETFLPNSVEGPNCFTFPYSVALIKVILKKRMINWLLNKPSWESFLQPEHPSKATEVTVGIVSKFIELCHKRKKDCLVVIFPTPSSFNWFRRTNRLAMQPLIFELEKIGVPLLDLTKEISNRLSEKSVCDILTNPKKCVGHFNSEGNLMIAEIIYIYLSSKYERFLRQV